jgi:hypothetical protein
MTFRPSSSPDKAEPGTLMAGVSLSTLAETGEVEIAGRRYVTDRRLADILDKNVRTLARWDAARIGPPKIKVGKLVLYDLAKVPDWLASRETYPTRNIRH